VNTVMNCRVPYDAGKFLSSCTTGSLSGRAQLHAVRLLWEISQCSLKTQCSGNVCRVNNAVASYQQVHKAVVSRSIALGRCSAGYTCSLPVSADARCSAGRGRTLTPRSSCFVVGDWREERLHLVEARLLIVALERQCRLERNLVLNELGRLLGVCTVEVDSLRHINLLYTSCFSISKFYIVSTE
jgi:hypothetical protein